VRVNVDGHVGELLAKSSNEAKREKNQDMSSKFGKIRENSSHGGSFRLEETSHLKVATNDQLSRAENRSREMRLTSLIARTWIPQSTSS
jgi:hypothetical protein